jgi:phosphatidylglycerol:prolipoprotein diacylglycerol transferase
MPERSHAKQCVCPGRGLGRVGCFLVGDDYGRPSDLPWAVAFPKGLPPTDVPVHPTQLYEAAALIIVAVLLFRWRRDRVDDIVVFGRYLVLAGAIRFAIEFVRINVRVLGPFSLAHLVSAALVLVGLAMLAWRSSSRT